MCIRNRRVTRRTERNIPIGDDEVLSKRKHEMLDSPLRRAGRRAFAAGFTLIELMIVITIIFILIGIAVGRYDRSVVRAREATLRARSPRVFTPTANCSPFSPPSIDELPQLGAAIKPAGGNWTLLTTDRTSGYVATSAWAPDGGRLATSTAIAGHPRGVYSRTAAGGDQRLRWRMPTARRRFPTARCWCGVRREREITRSSLPARLRRIVRCQFYPVPGCGAHPAPVPGRQGDRLLRGRQRANQKPRPRAGAFSIWPRIARAKWPPGSIWIPACPGSRFRRMDNRSSRCNRPRIPACSRYFRAMAARRVCSCTSRDWRRLQTHLMLRARRLYLSGQHAHGCRRKSFSAAGGVPGTSSGTPSTPISSRCPMANLITTYWRQGGLAVVRPGTEPRPLLETSEESCIPAA